MSTLLRPVEPVGEHARVMKALVGGLGLAARPYASLGDQLGMSEVEVLAAARALCEGRQITRISAVFDGARLGYYATLGALAVSEDDVESKAAAIDSLPGVAHVFEIEDRYSLWFAMSVTSPSRLEALESEIASRTQCRDYFRALPAELHAVAGSFEISGAPDACGPGTGQAEAAVLSRDERALVRLLQGAFPVCVRPCAELAATLVQCGFDVDERWVLERMQALMAEGVLVRLAAFARDRREPWRLAAAVWGAEGARADSISMITSFPETLHCLSRRISGGRASIMGLVEAPDRESIDRVIGRIRLSTGLAAPRLLYPVREFKRAPMKYFADGEW